eukprot:scaffold136544_cov148-Phaeocystis_antarctica.AAC.1
MKARAENPQNLHGAAATEGLRAWLLRPPADGTSAHGCVSQMSRKSTERTPGGANPAKRGNSHHDRA